MCARMCAYCAHLSHAAMCLRIACDKGWIVSVAISTSSFSLSLSLGVLGTRDGCTQVFSFWVAFLLSPSSLEAAWTIINVCAFRQFLLLYNNL